MVRQNYGTRKLPFTHQFNRLLGNKGGYNFEYNKLCGKGKYANPVTENVPNEYKILSDVEAGGLYTIPARAAMLMGVYERDWIKKRKGTIPENHDRSQFSFEKYKFFLEAPFEISDKCCKVMKKAPARATHTKFITAQMANESRLRTQAWIKQGCNAFDAKNPISNPMSFWVNQDVLLYIRLHDLPVCPIYGNVVTEDEYTGQVSLGSLLGLDETELFDLERPTLRTTGVDRSGCIFCGFGAFIEKKSRFDLIDKVSNPSLRDFCFRGGSFDEDGLFKPDNKGLGYWFVVKWINLAGNFNAYIPEYERYEKEYGNKRTAKELEKALQIGMSTKK